ncbi:ABC transporter permease [Eisenibacter elegans]|jgi:peptide/nickel transport system permease protein|uniref:ABC transporter permease n=1 Tax=Eisenibacter elegans TaxID=997 RepID=UPI000405BD1F|nr:ABC transporter permease [Eisenibacter elegans]
MFRSKQANTAEEEHHSPNYYIRKRFFSNPPAVIGMGIVFLLGVVALLGYSIMPDQTPNAVDGSIEIKTQPPGFKVTLLRERVDLREFEKRGFFSKMIWGQPSNYKPYPITSYRVDEQNLVVYYTLFDHGNIEDSKPIIDLIEDLALNEDNAEPIYKVEGDIVTYKTHEDGEVKTRTRKEVIDQFYRDCLREKTYLLGTDSQGRDLLSRLILGLRISFSIGFVSVIIALLVGVTLGSIAGFFGGWVDSIVMWFMSVVWSIPGIVLVIAISLALNSKGIWVAFVAVGLTTWVEIARLVRGQIMEIKQKLFVEAARALGFTNLHIIYLHILPNIIGPLIVVATSNFASAILIEAGLSFLGLGVQPPTPSWGSMVNDGFKTVTSYPYLVLFPSICISLMVLAFNLFGNGLRDAYDPKGTAK